MSAIGELWFINFLVRAVGNVLIFASVVTGSSLTVLDGFCRLAKAKRQVLISLSFIPENMQVQVSYRLECVPFCCTSKSPFYT